jgi:chemotaxis protein MotB
LAKAHARSGDAASIAGPRSPSKLAAGQQDKLIVNGYTDNAPVGSGLLRQGVTSNEILSQKRAEAVMQYMISQGVKPDMVTAKGWGDAQAVAPNTTPQERAENRRVEIKLAAS